ncbi:hypothetical protein PMIN07_010953 [Paraphaeosphaeria minitans]
MPPALSDYESDRDDATATSSERENSPPRTRKRGGLLSGLDAGNIITPDEVTFFTAEDNKPRPSYLIRGPARGARSNDLAYDQRYHPMDEYIRPSQAAKRRAEHGIEDNSSVHSVESDSDTDAEDQPQRKKRKLNKVITRGTRRSSRRTNHDVLYNMQIHPQDSQLEQMVGNTVDETAEENAEMISIGSSEAAEEEDQRVVLGITGKSPLSLFKYTFYRFDVSPLRVYRSVATSFSNTHADEASSSDISSPLRSTPLSTVSTTNEVQQSLSSDSHTNRSAYPSVESTPFAIYESFHTQFTNKAASPASLSYEHGDKSPNIIDQYLHSKMFDGPSDQFGVPTRLHVQVGDMDSDSVLSSDIDPVTSE